MINIGFLCQSKLTQASECLPIYTSMAAECVEFQRIQARTISKVFDSLVSGEQWVTIHDQSDGQRLG